MSIESRQKLYDIIDATDVAMLTTRRPDGHLRSRPMANQKHAPGADLWFVTSESSRMLSEIAADPHVNLAYYQEKSRQWVSIAGVARVTDDRQIVRALYAMDWKIWFGNEGDERHGTPEDPRIRLIGVTIETAEFLEVDKSKPALAFEFVKGFVTGEQPELGTMHRVSGPAPRPTSDAS